MLLASHAVKHVTKTPGSTYDSVESFGYHTAYMSMSLLTFMSLKLRAWSLPCCQVVFPLSRQSQRHSHSQSHRWPKFPSLIQRKLWRCQGVWIEIQTFWTQQASCHAENENHGPAAFRLLGWSQSWKHGNLKAH